MSLQGDRPIVFAAFATLVLIALVMPVLFGTMGWGVMGPGWC